MGVEVNNTPMRQHQWNKQDKWGAEELSFAESHSWMLALMHLKQGTQRIESDFCLGSSDSSQISSLVYLLSGWTSPHCYCYRLPWNGNMKFVVPSSLNPLSSAVPPLMNLKSPGSPMLSGGCLVLLESIVPCYPVKWAWSGLDLSSRSQVLS